MERGLIAPLPLNISTRWIAMPILQRISEEACLPTWPWTLAKPRLWKMRRCPTSDEKCVYGKKTILHFNVSYHSETIRASSGMLKQAIRKTSFELKLLTITCLEQTILIQFQSRMPQRPISSSWSQPPWPRPTTDPPVMTSPPPSLKPEDKPKEIIPKPESKGKIDSDDNDGSDDDDDWFQIFSFVII